MSHEHKWSSYPRGELVLVDLYEIIKYMMPVPLRHVWVR